MTPKECYNFMFISYSLYINKIQKNISIWKLQYKDNHLLESKDRLIKELKENDLGCIVHLLQNEKAFIVGDVIIDYILNIKREKYHLHIYIQYNHINKIPSFDDCVEFLFTYINSNNIISTSERNISDFCYCKVTGLFQKVIYIKTKKYILTFFFIKPGNNKDIKTSVDNYSLLTTWRCWFDGYVLNCDFNDFYNMYKRITYYTETARSIMTCYLTKTKLIGDMRSTVSKIDGMKLILDDDLMDSLSQKNI